MVLLEARFQPFQDEVGIVGAGLHDIDLLEAPAERLVLVEDAAVFVKSRGTYAAQLARTQQGLEQVAGVHDPAGGGTGPDDGVHLVDEQDGVIAFLQFGQQALEALLEITAVLGARQQGAQVQGINHCVLENVGHVAIDDLLGQTLDNRRLAHP